MARHRHASASSSSPRDAGTPSQRHHCQHTTSRQRTASKSASQTATLPVSCAPNLAPRPSAACRSTTLSAIYLALTGTLLALHHLISGKRLAHSGDSLDESELEPPVVAETRSGARSRDAYTVASMRPGKEAHRLRGSRLGDGTALQPCASHFVPGLVPSTAHGRYTAFYAGPESRHSRTLRQPRPSHSFGFLFFQVDSTVASLIFR